MKKFYPLLIALCFTFQIIDAQNSGVLLDGNTEQLTIPHKDAFEIGDQFTIEAWIFANSWTTEIWRGSIFTNDSPGPDRGYAFRCGDNGKLSFVMAVDNAWNEVFSTSLMNQNQWHHVAAVVANGTMLLYLDGQEIANATYSGTPSANESAQNIGASTGFGGRFFDGVIDEVRVWNVARSQQEIADNISTEFTGTEAGLVAYFPMNDGSGTTATNLVDAACSAAGVDIDDSNWVNGYQLPNFDLSMQSIAGIDRVNMKTRPVKMKVALQNVGIEAVTGFDIQIAIDGSLSLEESFDVTLEAGEVLEVELTTPIDLTSFDSPEIEASVNFAEDENSLNNSTSMKLSTIAGNFIRLFDNEQHNFGGKGQNQNVNVVLPSDLSGYSQLLLHINLSCPSSGCDPWDQPAKVIAQTADGSFEIARYITPYGIGCGQWTLDITDFKSILQGGVNYNSFIQVWGPSGWLATIDIELVEGTDALPYSKLSPLWRLDYQVYGDPAISHDLPEMSVDVASITEASHVRMQVTGHGQGNTNNAAEFFQATHDFNVNGTMLDQHLLWKADCASNSCADQAGNWLFSRAGWCPGQEVQPKIFETTSAATAGNTATFDYVLQDYVNLLNTGYNNSGHTEPHLRIHGFFIERSSQRYNSYSNLLVDNIAIMADLQTLEALDITVRNDGSETITEFDVKYFINSELISTETVSESVAPGATYTHSFAQLNNFESGQNVIFGEVDFPGDENPGDDVSKIEYGFSVSTNSVELLKDFTIQPNPSTRNVYVNLSENLLQGQMSLLSIDGRQIATQVIRSSNQQFTVQHPGTYLLRVSDRNGFTATKKVVVID